MGVGKLIFIGAIIKLMAVELGEFPKVTVRNHARETTVIDFTPTEEDRFIREFPAGNTNIPSTFGTISRSGIRLTIGGDPEDAQGVESGLQIEIVTFETDGTPLVEVIPNESFDQRVIRPMLRRTTIASLHRPKQVTVFKTTLRRT